MHRTSPDRIPGGSETDAVGEVERSGRPTRHSPPPLLRQVASTMQPTLIRRQLGGLVPPKIASPSLLVGCRFALRSCQRFYSPHMFRTVVGLGCRSWSPSQLLFQAAQGPRSHHRWWHQSAILQRQERLCGAPTGGHPRNFRSGLHH